jgi:16S rRNA (adenine1518-N6/adenine1519-N6)-dimethyltransferase
VELLTPTSIRDALDRFGIRPKKSLGQNFLADPNSARRIARLAEVGDGEAVLEIGPGLGSLTAALVERGARVRAVEVDDRLAAALVELLGPEARGVVEVRVADVLAVPLAELLADPPGGDQPWACVSNLPYNVAVPVVVRLLEGAPTVERLVVLVQREVGERLAAGPGDEQYGAVSVKVAYYAEAAVLGAVPPSVFLPQPKVDSVVVGMARRAAPPVDVPGVDALFDLVRSGFGQRRKMLRRSLQPVLGARTVSVLDAAGVAPTARAETLGLEEWAAVARCAAVAA